MLLEAISTLNFNNIDWSLWISILAFALSLFTYIRHDRKLKKQERQLNEHELRKISQEKDENSKAAIKANVIKHEKGKRIIKVYNAGKSIAKDIKLEILSDESGFHAMGLERFPYEFLNPQDSTEFTIFLFLGSTDTIKIRLNWDDGFAQNNKYEQILSL